MAGRADEGVRWSAVVAAAGKGAAEAEGGTPYCISDGGTRSYTINVYNSGIRVRCLEPHTWTG